MSSTNHRRLKICLLVIVSSLFASSIHADNLQSSTTLATTTTTKQQPEHDQIPASSDENSSNNGDVDGSSSNKFETTVQSPNGHQLEQQQQQQHHQPQSPQQQPQSQERPLHLLLQSSSEQDVSSQSAQGQFMPLSDKEVGSGHVTMIGYTTPIVKFGDPIPLEEFLKQAQKQRDEAASAAAGSSNVLPPSSSSDQHFAQIIARMAENSPNMQEARSASVDTPLRLLLANQQQQQQQQQTQNLQQAQANEALGSRPQLIQIQAADVNSNEIEKFGRQISFDQGELFSYLVPGTQTLDLQREQKLSPLLLQQQQPQLQLQPQPQSRPQFAAPMEKPRPFLVMKPGFPKQNQQKLLQHIQIQHQIPQQQLAQQQQAKLSQLIPQQPQQLQQPEDRFKLIPSQLVLPAQVTNELVDNPANPFAGFTPMQSLSQANEQTSSQIFSSSRQPLGSLGKLDHFQPQSRSRIHVGPNPPPFGSHFFGSQTPFGGSGQAAHSSFLRTAKLSDQLTAAAPPSSAAQQQASSVDTKAQLQDQIKHVLTTSPNLSEDSRVKHRDAIFKAVQSLVDTTTASEHLDSGAIRVMDGSQLTSSHNPSAPTGHSMIRDDRLSGFPQFHPKSMLFRMPTTSNVNAPTVSSSLLNNGERKPFMQAPVAQAPGLNFLPRLPTLLPGLHQQQNAVSQGVLNSLHQQPQQQLLPAQHHQQPHPSLLLQPQPQLISTVSGHVPPTNQQQLQADQKIQSQIQSFLQQNDPLRQQLAAQLHLSNPNPNHHLQQQQQQQQLQQQHQLPPQFFTTFVQQSGSEASPTASLFPGAPSRFILENPHQTLLAPQQHQTGGKIRLGPGLLLNAEEDNGGSMANHFGTMSEQQGSHHHQKRADHAAHHHHHHHHLHQVNQNNEKQSEPQPEQSRQSSSPLTPYQPDESSFLAHAPKPTTTMREYSEWWKERALAAEAAEAAANAMSLIPPVA